MLNLYKPACPEQTCQMHRKSPTTWPYKNPFEFHLFHLYQQNFANIVFMRTNIIYDIKRHFFSLQEQFFLLILIMSVFQLHKIPCDFHAFWWERIKFFFFKSHIMTNGIKKCSSNFRISRSFRKYWKYDIYCGSAHIIRERKINLTYLARSFVIYRLAVISRTS